MLLRQRKEQNGIAYSPKQEHNLIILVLLDFIRSCLGKFAYLVNLQPS